MIPFINETTITIVVAAIAIYAFLVLMIPIYLASINSKVKKANDYNLAIVKALNEIVTKIDKRG